MGVPFSSDQPAETNATDKIAARNTEALPGGENSRCGPVSGDGDTPMLGLAGCKSGLRGKDFLENSSVADRGCREYLTRRQDMQSNHPLIRTGLRVIEVSAFYAFS